MQIRQRQGRGDQEQEQDDRVHYFRTQGGSQQDQAFGARQAACREGAKPTGNLQDPIQSVILRKRAKLPLEGLQEEGPGALGRLGLPVEIGEHQRSHDI